MLQRTFAAIGVFIFSAVLVCFPPCVSHAGEYITVTNDIDQQVVVTWYRKQLGPDCFQQEMLNPRAVSGMQRCSELLNIHIVTSPSQQYSQQYNHKLTNGDVDEGTILISRITSIAPAPVTKKKSIFCSIL